MKESLVNILPRNKLIYRICKSYVDFYNAENNGNIQTNGELRLMHAVLPQCMTVFDVGANIGDWSTLALGINPQLRIHCFEPSLATFQRLQARLEGKVVKCQNIALSSKPGELLLQVFADGSGENSLYRREGLEDGWKRSPQTKTELVRVETLDGYCQRTNVLNIDFLKVDVEGHELEVFKGAQEMLKKGGIKYIQFEYGGCNIDARMLLKDLFNSFLSYNYTLYKIYPHELRHVPRYDQRLENFQYQNWVAAAKGVTF